MDTAILMMQLTLAGVFATAGVSKLLDMPGTQASLVGFGVPERAARRTAPLVPLSELAVAVALVPAASAGWGAVGALVLLVGFSAAIANALAQGRAPDCGCFGNLHSAQVGRPMLLRNFALAALAAAVVVAGPDVELGDWVSARTAAELTAIGLALGALALLALSLQLHSQNGSLRADLQKARRVIADMPEPPPLAIGAPAPDFELPGLRGGTRNLAQLRASGLPVLLLFFDPNCGPCWDLRPHLARWQAALSDRMAIAVISGGTVERNEFAWTGHDAEVLLEVGETQKVSAAYCVRAWPQMIAIGRDGRIAYEPLTSSDAMEALIRRMLRDDAPVASPEGVTVAG